MLLHEGTGRTKVSLSTQTIGDDLVVFLFNDQGHIGAVAVADYSFAESRASTSVITRLGHKDDEVARSASHRICKSLKKPVCVIAGIHLDGITEAEINAVLKNCDKLIGELLSAM